MIRSKSVLMLVGLAVVAGCSMRETVPTNYYILEYFPHTEKKTLQRSEPFPFSVMVEDTRIPNTYDRRQIVIRHFGPRITYSDHHVWAVELGDIIPNLISKRLAQYGVFQRVQREFLEKRPDYVISTRINNIEMYESEHVKEARLNMDFTLRRVDQEIYQVQHTVNREQVLLDENVETFVQVINTLIFEETDRFIDKIICSFTHERPKLAPCVAEMREDTLAIVPAEEEISQGMGMLLLPSLTKTNNEPAYKIYTEDGQEIVGQMGIPTPLQQGEYSIRYGSGSSTQMMEKTDIRIVPRFKTIVEPEWTCLVVDIIDEKRNFAKVRYEIFDSESGMSYGTEFPAEKELGEQQRIWVVKPGLYKITINGEPFNTYRDFTTIFLEKGEVRKLTIVVDTDDEGNPTNMIGAGILEEDELLTSSANWRFVNAIHGNANMNSANEKSKDEREMTVTLNTQLENIVMYDKLPWNYTMRNLIELGTTKTSDTDFRISTDEFYLKNTFIFYFLKNIGLYGRFDTQTHFFDEYFYSSENFNYIKRDNEGHIIETKYDVDNLRIKQPFLPLVLKEGVGINYRVLNVARANLNVRLGFGMRQDINQNVYNLADATETIGGELYKVYVEKESVYKEGTEVSLVGNFQLPLNLTYYTNADFLFPFDPDQSIAVEWENVFNLKLFKYISLDYKIRLLNKQPEEGKEYIVDRHTLFLRITYFLK